MTQINQNYDVNNVVYSKPQMPANSGMQRSMQTSIPEYYNVSTEDKKNWREAIKSNPLTSLPYEFLLRGTEHPIPTLLTWLGLSYGLNAYSNASGGEYNKSLLKKVANFGDSIENSGFIKSKPMQFILGGFKKGKGALEKASEHSAVIRAMQTTPSMPEWPIVKQELLPHRLKVCEDFFKITNTLHLADGHQASLKDLDITKKETEALKKFFNVSKVSEIPEQKAVNHVLLSQIGKNDAEIKTILSMGEKASEATKAEIRKTLNNISAETIKKAEEEISKGDMFGKYYETVLNATKAGGKKVRIRAGHYGFLGPISKPFERVVGCDEIYNKLWSISGGAKTDTGKFLSKLMQMSHRGLTFGQGKLGCLLLIAPSLVEIGRDTAKAEPNEKIGTAVHGFVENISWVFTFPIALHIMHSLGGVQYAGMSKTQVGEYRDIINKFNENNKKGVFKTKAQYDAAKEKAKKLLKEKSTVKNQNIFTKGLRKIARAFTMDLETFKAYEGQNLIMKKLHQTPNFFKNCFGVPVRFGVWSALSMFVLGGLLTKGTQLLFGKAYDSMKHEENKENKKSQKQFLKEDLKERLYKVQAQKQSGTSNVTQTPRSLQGAHTAARGNSYKEQNDLSETVDNYSYIPSSENTIPTPKGKGSLDTYSYIPSEQNTLKKNDSANPNMRKYIPSQAGAKIEKTWDNSGLESALKRADKAEEKALRVLAGKFEN